MQNNYSEYKLVIKCLREIEEQLDWGNSTNWHNDVFSELSETIHKKTNVLLSITTLKRVWGKVNYNSAPSISTLNTLANFAGYINWRDFKNKNNSNKFEKLRNSITPNLRVIVTSASILALVFISFFSLTSRDSNSLKNDFSNVNFQSKSIGKSLPSSVIFDLNIENITSDSIYIQQFWDVTKTIKLKQNQKQATGIYYFPGYFNATLLVDGKSIREHDLFIKSNGWLGTIDYEPIPKYYLQKDIVSNKMALPNTAIDLIKNSETSIQSSFHFVKDFGDISGDNFSLNTTIKNSYDDKWAVCQTTKIIILGTKGAMIIPFSIPGCVSDINLLLNDVYLNGKENDLSAFGVNFSLKKDIEIKIINKELKLFVNNNEVYSNKYNDTMGRLVGVRYRFIGALEVEKLVIIDEITKSTVLNETFSSL